MSARPYHDYAVFLERRYGGRVYRVPIDLGLGCPHRDPVTGAGGCAFCGAAGARAVHLDPGMTVAEQVRAGVAFGRNRYRADVFIAYLQAFTSTYAAVERLRELYGEVLGAAPFRGLVLSTRPDCLSPGCLDYLAELGAALEVWVELGIQTANDASLARVNRGHTFACSQDAVRNLARRGIQVTAHVILGLPGEGPADFQYTATALTDLPLAAVKIHNLHVLRDTPLAEAWRRGEVRVYDEHEYGEILMDFLRRIPWAWPVVRLTADTRRSDLLAPRWWLTKDQFLGYLGREMGRRGWRQGDLAGR